MKIIFKILFIVLLAISFFGQKVDATSFFQELLGGETPGVWIDCEGQDCNIQSGIEIVKGTVNGIETERSFSEYIQSIVVYIVGFISIIAVVYIIYAGFRILTGAGNEETIKKQKSTILYVVIGILLIWLAFPIVKFISNIIDN